MSHFSVMVIGNDPEEQLASFDENLKVEEDEVGIVSDQDKDIMMDHYRKEYPQFSTFEECYQRFGEQWNGSSYRLNEDGVWTEYSSYNPNARWDWYQLGGRFSGYYIRLKPGFAGMCGESGVFKNKIGVDQAFKKDIDFQAIRSERHTQAISNYREFAKACGGKIPHLEYPWPLTSPEHQALSSEKKCEFYHAQESVKLWNQKVCDNNPFGPQLEDFQCSEEEYAHRQANRAFAPFAVVKDNEWYEIGEMGWWGMHTNEMTEEEWNQKVGELLDGLPDNTLISFYDCHI